MLAAAAPLGRHTQAETNDTRVPGAAWTSVKPESVGYSSARLELLRAWLKTLDTKAMLVAYQGQVIFEHGDVTHASKIASVRKSVLSMLYGPYVAGARSIWAGRSPISACRRRSPASRSRRTRSCTI
jgi:hypothetical protein